MKKVAIVTGASSGIGFATAEAFGQQGMRIVINGRHVEALQAARKRLEEQGIETLAVPGDVTRYEDCEALAIATLENFGRADVLVCNAGISMRALFQELETEVIRQVMEVNFFGVVHTVKAFIPHLLESKGSIVGVSSIAGYHGLPGRTGYSASKAALQGFLEALRIELMESGVHILVAAPGFTASQIRERALTAYGKAQGESPLEEGKIMTAEAVGKAIAEATLHRKRDLVLTTQGRLTVWLSRLFPGFLDGLVRKHFQKEKGSPFEELILKGKPAPNCGTQTDIERGRGQFYIGICFQE